MGATLSSTLTVASQVLSLPLASVTVRVTVLAPTSAQPKSVWLRAKLAAPQASLEPLSTAAAVVLPLPLSLSCTVTFRQSASGATLSSTLTVASQVLSLPLASVTVRVHGIGADIRTAENRFG